MKLRSRGLGRKELEMDFREYEVKREDDDVLITGTIKKPVHWDFSIRMSPEDIPGMIKVAISPATIGMFFRWLNPFKKRSKGDETEAAPASMAASRAAKPEAGDDGGSDDEKLSRRDRKKAAKEAAAQAEAADAETKSSESDDSSAKSGAESEGAAGDDKEGTAA